MIILDQDISVKKIADFHANVLKSLEDDDEVVIDFSNVERVDCSLVQVIIAAGRKAKIEGKTIKLKSLPRPVKYQMQVCGLKI